MTLISKCSSGGETKKNNEKYNTISSCYKLHKLVLGKECYFETSQYGWKSRSATVTAAIEWHYWVALPCRSEKLAVSRGSCPSPDPGSGSARWRRSTLFHPGTHCLHLLIFLHSSALKPEKNKWSGLDIWKVKFSHNARMTSLYNFRFSG